MVGQDFSGFQPNYYVQSNSMLLHCECLPWALSIVGLTDVDPFRVTQVPSLNPGVLLSRLRQSLSLPSTSLSVMATLLYLLPSDFLTFSLSFSLSPLDLRKLSSYVFTRRLKSIPNAHTTRYLPEQPRRPDNSEESSSDQHLRERLSTKFHCS